MESFWIRKILKTSGIFFVLNRIALTDLKLKAEGYLELPSSLKLAGCKQLDLLYCHLSEAKISNLGNGCENSNFMIKELFICDDSMNGLEFYQLAVTLGKSKCSNLALHNCKLNMEKITGLAQRHYNNYVQSNILGLTDITLTPEEFFELSASLKLMGCKRLDLTDCGLSEKKISSFGNGCKNMDWAVQRLAIGDTSMSSSEYYQLAVTVGQSGCPILILNGGQLNRKKLSGLAKGFHDHPYQLQELLINDPSMGKSAYCELVPVIGQSKCSKLYLQNCRLNQEKLSGLAEQGRHHQVKLPMLQITHDLMDVPVYYQLAQTIGKSEHPKLFLVECQLNEEKLIRLAEGFLDHHVQIQLLNIGDISMEKPGYYQLAMTIERSKCPHLSLENCQLTKEKLSGLTEGFRDYQVQLQELQINDKFMDIKGYHQLALSIEQSKCPILILDDCQLSKEKLIGLAEGFLEHHVETMQITVNDISMDRPGYFQLPLTMQKAKSTFLFLQECQLTSEKLSGLAQGFLDHDVQMEQLTVFDITIDRLGYYQLALIVEQSKCQFLIFFKCQLTEEKLTGLTEGFREHNVKILKVTVSDISMDGSGYRQLAEAIEQSRSPCLTLWECQLNVEKLSGLARGFSNYPAQLQELELGNNFMDVPAYYQLALTICLSKCSKLFFVECQLNKDKLIKLAEGFLENPAQIRVLNVMDVSMDKHGFFQLVLVIRQTRCPHLTLKSCQLTEEKLFGLAKGFYEYHAQLERLQINCDYSMSASAYCQLLQAIGQSHCQELVLEDCRLNEEKLNGLAMGFNMHHVQIRDLSICDITVDRHGYYQLALTVGQSKCRRLTLDRCQLNEEKLSGLAEGFHDHHVQLT